MDKLRTFLAMKLDLDRPINTETFRRIVQRINPNNFVHDIVLLEEENSLSQTARAEWYTDVKELYKSEGFTLHETLSTVFNTRNYSVLITQKENQFIVIASRKFFNYLYNYYKIYLAISLLLHKDDVDYIKRVTKVIQSTDDIFMEWSEEELRDMEQFQRKLDTQQFKNFATSSLKTYNFEAELDNIKNNINALEDKLLHAYTDLKNTELRKYAAEVFNDTIDEAVNEFMDYFPSLSSKMLAYKLGTPNLFTLATWMYIDPSSEDYFKEEALAASRHQLHSHPFVARLLKEVMEQTLRLPILAHFHIRQDSRGGIIQIHGEGSFNSNDYNQHHYVTNAHVVRYNCFDGYKQKAIKAAHDNDLIGMFEILLQATASINVFDNIAMNYIIPSIQQLAPTTPLEVRTENGWEQITLEEYKRRIVNEDTEGEPTDSDELV